MPIRLEDLGLVEPVTVWPQRDVGGGLGEGGGGLGEGGGGLGEGGGGEGEGGEGDGEGGVNMQMHWLDEEHEPELPASKTESTERRSEFHDWSWKTQPGGCQGVVLYVKSHAVWSGRSSAVAAALHSLMVETTPAPQEPLSIT